MLLKWAHLLTEEGYIQTRHSSLVQMLVSKSMNFSRKRAGQAYMVTQISQYLGSFDTNYIICKNVEIFENSLRVQNL
jgi:hypothetical protein